MVALPPRYESQYPLGKGGGGEVWAVRDRVTGRTLALKALAADAGVDERLALVREAMALSGLEGLGVPQVVAFGALRDVDGSERHYMVRELAPGTTLADALEARDVRDLLLAIDDTAQKLTAIHRAGLLHGDIKPANIIVDDTGRATLVDLGLARPWRKGTQAEGLTPKYAAPELFRGEPLTVRAEVYSLGATLADVLSRGRMKDALGEPARQELRTITDRAMAEDPAARYPSVDEFASALRHSAHLARPALGETEGGEPAWPVLGLEGVAQALGQEVAELMPGDALAIVGPHGSGRTTLALRLAWTLGIEGRAVARIEAPRGGLSMAEVVEMELSALPDAELSSAVVIVDDAHLLDREARNAMLRASQRGVRIVGVGSVEDVARLCDGETLKFPVPPLERRAAEELVRRAMPSLPKALVDHLVEKTHSVPGRLRAALRALGNRPVVSIDEIDATLHAERAAATRAPPSVEPEDRFAAVERLLDTGRIDEAEKELAQVGDGSDAPQRVRLAMAYARAALGRGDPGAAAVQLDAVRNDLTDAGSYGRAWKVTRARAHLRIGAYAEAAALAEEAVHGDDTRSADALSVQGIALAFTGDEARGRAALARSLEL